MRISVLIPTYKRPKYLARCLSSLERQSRLPDEVVVVVRTEDIKTQNVLKNLMDKSNLNIKMVYVNEPGIGPAENAGLNTVTGDVVAFTDDDCEPFEDWIERIERYYKDENIGGVGGRAILYQNEQPVEMGSAQTVGKLLWFGRMIGNHHLNIKNVQYVDSLCGGNMSFRRKLIQGLDVNLKGNAFGFEIDMSLGVRKANYRIVFDPKIRVKHFAAWSDEITEREKICPYFTNAHNSIYVMLKHLSYFRKIFFLVYFMLVGDPASQGPFIALFLIKRRIPISVYKAILESLQGKIAGLNTYRTSVLSKKLARR